MSSVEAVISPKRNREAPRDDDRDRYAARHPIVHFFCRLKQFRRIATRCDKTRCSFLVGIYLAGTASTLNCGHTLASFPETMYFGEGCWRRCSRFIAPGTV